MVSESIKTLLNERIYQEELSSRLYTAMSVWLDNFGYKGAAKWLKKQANDELDHAQWSRDYLMSFDILPETRPLEAVETAYSNLQTILLKVYEHELLVTKQCNDLAKRAMTEGDFLCFSLAQKYLDEQREELEVSNDVVTLLKVYGETPVGLGHIDEILGEMA